MTPARKDEVAELKHLVKKCPHCHGIVLEIAVRCRHCKELVHDSRHTQTTFSHPRDATTENYMPRSLCGIFQLLGLLLISIGLTELKTIYLPLILFPSGIAFWMVGAMGVRWKKCSNCGCTIANKDISKCPRCYFEFSS